ncbi:MULTISPECIES: hypothetical protein [Cohnella]|uniref:hypothetical protein n=1 Tax=Cohnella TaxID=329857 RepID=UPI0009BBB730|nr:MULTISPECIES: hypothetical protein [Cohnella]MBN2983300.1 hypothetical protein [Cohnella algarum]
MAKRSYMAPIVVILLTVMGILLVLLYSRVLLDDQSRKTEQGKRLASNYTYCQYYSSLLQEGAEAMLAAAEPWERLPAAQSFGKLTVVGAECSPALIQSGTLSGQDQAAATDAVTVPIQKINETAASIGGHDGPLAEAETTMLRRLAEAGAKLEETLASYSVPTKDASFRLMASGADWTEPAQEAAKQLKELADSLP